MPHVVFDIGSIGATEDNTETARKLIPGVEPGGSRAGKSKPVLLIRDAWIEVNNIITPAGVDMVGFTWSLKLSQDQDLNPGLLLPVGQVLLASATATLDEAAAIHVRDLFHAQGTVWAPAWVGVRIVEQGAGAAIDADVHLDYEVIEAPWMDWFIMWEWLDGIVDNEREY